MLGHGFKSDIHREGIGSGLHARLLPTQMCARVVPVMQTGRIFALDGCVSDSIGWMASQGGVRRLRMSRVRDGKHFGVASLRMIKRRGLSGEPGLAKVPVGQGVHVAFPVKTW